MEEIAEELCIAAQVGDIMAVNDLITKKGVDIHGMDSIGYLPLHYAISHGHVEVVKLLLENGADPTCYLSGHSSMELAARFGQIDVSSLIPYY